MELSDIAELSYDEATGRIAEATYKWLGDELGRFVNGLSPDLGLATSAYLQRSGKALRPILLMLSAMATGVSEPSAVVPACAAVEVYHNATLVHDDIIDQDDLRRGKPTVHALIRESRSGKLAGGASPAHYALSTAILAGDMLFSFSSKIFTEMEGFPAEVLLSIAAEQSGNMNPGLLKGEQLDLELEHKPLSEVTTGEIEEMMALKTSLLLSFAARVGAALGSAQAIGRNPVGEKLAEGVTAAGLAFQLQDDILGIFGDEKLLGKPIGSDLREGKRTLLIIETWRHASAEQRIFLENNLGRQDMTDETVNALRRLIEESGALQAVRETAAAHIAVAEKSLECVENPAIRSLLAEFMARLTRRRK